MAEFHWHYDCFEAFLAAHGPVEGTDYATFPVTSRQTLLAWMAKGHTPPQGVAGVRSGLTDAVGAMRYLSRDTSAKGAALHANYLALLGRTLEDDIALAKQAQP